MSSLAFSTPVIVKSMKENNRKKVILVSSDGGHLAQLLELNDWFANYNYLLVTERANSTLPLRERYHVSFLSKRPRGRKRNFLFFMKVFFNFLLSIRLIFRHYPKVIITTGSHAAVPMCLIGKFLGIKIVYILSYARINSRELSADIVYRIADRFIIQWPGVQKFYKNSIFLGGIY